MPLPSEEVRAEIAKARDRAVTGDRTDRPAPWRAFVFFGRYPSSSKPIAQQIFIEMRAVIAMNGIGFNAFNGTKAALLDHATAVRNGTAGEVIRGS